MTASLFLTDPQYEYRDAFRSMVHDYIQAQEHIYINLYKPALDNFEKYVALLHHYARGRKLPYHEVPHSTFWLTDSTGKIYGNIRIRHRALQVYGHIGYDIRPSCRGQGMGTRLLRLGLEKAKHLQLGRVKIACDERNKPSVHIIESNGGVFLERLYDRKTRLFVNRYCIDL
jgi:predicted acetyltransferase